MFICLALPFVGCGSSNDIDSLTVTPTTLTFGGAGLTAQLRAIATIGHGSHPATTKDVTDLVNWTTVSSEVAAVTKAGLVTSGVDTGLVQITASIQGFTGLITSSCSVTVTTPTSSAIRKESTPIAIVDGFQTPAAPGETRQLKAVGTSGTEGVQEDFTDRVTWISSNPATATVSKSGLVTGLSRGTTTIMATVTNPDKTVAAFAVGFTVTD
jgi:uncharacterized protein YjdB